MSTAVDLSAVLAGGGVGAGGGAEIGSVAGGNAGEIILGRWAGALGRPPGGGRSPAGGSAGQLS